MSLWNVIRPAKDRPTRSAIATGLVMAVVSGLGSLWDFQQTRDGPREMATVVERQEVGPSICSGRRRGFDPKVNLTWRSETPPPGLPAEFTEVAVCSSNKVGERVEIIRVVEEGRTKVYEDVVHSGRESVENAIWTFVIGSLIAVPLWWLGFGLTRWWGRGRTDRRQRDEERSDA